MSTATALNEKRVVRLEAELVQRTRVASITRDTLVRIQNKAVERGADITSAGQERFTARVIQAELDYAEVWDEIYAALTADGWDEKTCSTPVSLLREGTVSYTHLPAPEAAE